MATILYSLFLNVWFQISVRKQNGSLVNLIDPQKKTITVVRERFYADVDESSIAETTHELDENGNCFLSIDVARNESSFSLKVICNEISFISTRDTKCKIYNHLR